MAKSQYCWRCRTDLPMLEEGEWEQLVPHLSGAAQQIKQYREEHGVSLAGALEKGYGQKALAFYFELTGYSEKNPDSLWHHRLSRFGPLCHACGKPLRTPMAKHCAECGAYRNSLAGA